MDNLLNQARNAVQQGAQDVHNLFGGNPTPQAPPPPQPVQQPQQSLPQNVANFIGGASQNIGQGVVNGLRSIGQGETSLEQNVPLYGQFEAGIRNTVAPYIQNISPQVAQQYQGFSQPLQTDIASRVAQGVGSTVPYIGAAAATAPLVTAGLGALGISAPAAGAGVLARLGYGALNAGLTGGILGGAQYSPTLQGRLQNALGTGANFAAFGAVNNLGVPRLVGGALNAGVGGASATVNDLLQTGKINPQDVISNTILGGALGLTGAGRAEATIGKSSIQQLYEQNLMDKVNKFGVGSLNPDEGDYFMKNMTGTKLLQTKPNATTGELQQASQAQRGLPELANFDVATRNGNFNIARQIGQDMLNDPVYSQYKNQIQSLMSSLPQEKPAPQLNLAQQIEQKLGLPTDLNPESGAINFGAKIGGKPKLTPETVPGEKSIGMNEVANYAPELTTAKGINKVQTVLDNAQSLKGSFDKDIKAIADDNGADFSSRVKNLESSIGKITQQHMEGKTNYNAKGLNDAYGARIVIQNEADRANVVKEIEQAAKDGDFEILKGPQDVEKDTYGATHTDIQKRLPDGTFVRGEIQIHTPQSLAEAVKNHPIRSVFGENPPPQIDAVKQANAQAADQLTNKEAKQATDILLDKHKQIGEVETLKDELQQPQISRPPIVSPTAIKAEIAGNPEPLPWEQGAKNINQVLAGGKYKMEENLPIAEPVKKGKDKYLLAEPEQQTKNQVKLPINGANENEKVQAAIVNSERIKNEINTIGKDAYIAGTKLSPQDLKLAERYQEGISVDELAKQAQNPEAFKTFMNKITNYYDFRLAADRAAGGSTPLRENYLRQRWDLSNPQDLARFNEFAKQQGVKPYNGYSSQPRVFATYAQGEAAGFKRQNPNILGDLKDDFGAASHVISRQALIQGLSEAAPDKMSTTGRGLTPEGKPFINSNISGLEGISFHPDLNKKLQGYQPLAGTNLFDQVKEKGLQQGLKDTGAASTVASLYDHSSMPMKHMLLNFSGFHSINISGNYAGSQIFHPISAARGLIQSIPSFFSERVTQSIINGFKNKAIPGRTYSVFDAGLRAGVNMDRGLPAQGLEKANIFNSLSRSMFDRELYTLKLNLVDQVFGSGKIDPETPIGREAGIEINKVMGEINMRTMNMNPNTQKWFSRFLLAPQFTESKYSILKDAFLKYGGPKGVAGAIARDTVIGKSLVFGTLSTLGTYLATGQLPALQQLLTNYTLNPSIQTNLTNPKGHKLDITLPTTFVSEPGKPLTGLLQGSTTALTHYGQARLNPILSTGLAAYTNQDYYGRPIVDVNSKTPVASQLAQNLGIGKLPIGVQNVVRLMQGNINPAQATIQIAGLRTAITQSDPTVQYFNNVNQIKGTLSPNDQARFNTLHPQTKDANGNPIPDSTVLTPQKLELIFSSPAMLAAEQKLRASEPTPTDPKLAQAVAYSNGVIQSLKDNNFNVNDISNWNTLHEAKLDKNGQPLLDNNGQPIYVAGPIETPEKATLYLDHQKLQDAEVELHNQGLNNDPLWGLSQDQRSLVLAARANLPGQTNQFKKLLSTQPWYSQFLNAQSQYYNSLPQQGNTQGGAPQPSSYVQQQLNAKNYNDPQVQSYFNRTNDYNNQRLIQMGLPAIAGNKAYPGGSAGGGGGTTGGIPAGFRRELLRSSRYATKEGNYKVGKLIGKLTTNIRAPIRRTPSLSGKITTVNLKPNKSKSLLNLPKLSIRTASVGKVKPLTTSFRPIPLRAPTHAHIRLG